MVENNKKGHGPKDSAIACDKLSDIWVMLYLLVNIVTQCNALALSLAPFEHISALGSGHGADCSHGVSL
jgi:hypothetical protein